MTSIIDGRTLFWRFMSRTEKNPLFSRSHLRACWWKTLSLKFDCKSIKFETKLPIIISIFEYIDWFKLALIYLKCSYFQTPSSCPSGIVKSFSTFDGSLRIICWMNCCTTKVLSISSKFSSGHWQNSCTRVKRRRNKKSWKILFLYEEKISHFRQAQLKNC